MNNKSQAPQQHFQSNLSPTSISVLQNNPKSDPNWSTNMNQVPTNSTSFGHSPPPKLISCSTAGARCVPASPIQWGNNSTFNILQHPSSPGACWSEPPALDVWAERDPDHPHLHLRALSTPEHAATAAPLMDKKKNRKGGSAFPSISALISKVWLLL